MLRFHDGWAVQLTTGPTRTYLLEYFKGVMQLRVRRDVGNIERSLWVGPFLFSILNRGMYSHPDKCGCNEKDVTPTKYFLK